MASAVSSFVRQESMANDVAGNWAESSIIAIFGLIDVGWS